MRGRHRATVNGTTQGTGTDAEPWPTRPINKYFYNLMNAMGVKADADGLSRQGGHGAGDQVRLLRQDRGLRGGYGAVAGATIHSPGEYTALKAGS